MINAQRTSPESSSLLQSEYEYEPLKQTPLLLAEDESSASHFWADSKLRARLYQSDTLKLLERARPCSVDLVFADPPYFLSNGGITCQSGRVVSVNKGAWDTPTTLEEMHQFNTEWLRLCHRVSRSIVSVRNGLLD